MRLTGDRCQCRVCWEFFNSTTAFDKHRMTPKGETSKRCLSVSEMQARGMVRSGKGFWCTKVSRFGEMEQAR